MKFKRLTAIFTSFLFIMCTFMMSKINVKAADSPALSYSISQSSISPGDTFDITVNCASVSDLYGASIDFKYDTSLIQVTGIDKGSVFSSASANTATPTNDTANGLISFYEMLTGNVAGYNVSTASSLFVIHAKALKTGTINLNTTDNSSNLSNTGFNVCVKLSDSTANKINYTANGQAINIVNAPVTITGLASDLASPQLANSTINFTATANGGVSPLLYQFCVTDSTGSKVAQDYSVNNKFAWVPTVSGDYSITVNVKSTGSANAYDASKTISYKIAAPVIVTDLTSDLSSPQLVNSTINFTATANGGVSPLLYQFCVTDSTGSKVAQDYSVNNKFAWVPTVSGDYSITVNVKSTGSANAYDASKTISYKIAAPVNVTDLTSDLSSPQLVNKTITFTATASGGTAALLYQFWIKDSSGWKMIQDYSSNNKFVWTPTVSGSYLISAYVKSTDSSKSVDAAKVVGFIINKPVAVTGLTSDSASPQAVNKTINFTAAASGGTASLLYQFWVKDSSGWKMVQDYSSNNKFAWTPTATGSYLISVYVKSSDSSNAVDAIKIIDYTINNPISLTGLTSDLASPQTSGKAITFTAAATGGTAPLLYQFWVKDSSGWKVVQDYSTSNTYKWTPASTGAYLVSVYVKSSGSTKSVEAAKVVGYNVISSVNITGLTSDLTSPQASGKTVTFTAAATGGAASLLYQFWVKDSSGWKMIQDYSSSNKFAWTPAANGAYLVSVYVKSTGSSNVEACKIISYTIANPINITGFASDLNSPQTSGSAITFTATANGGTAPLLYQFWVKDSSGWKVVQNYSTSNTYKWTPSASGSYYVAVYVKSTGSSASVEAFKIITYTIK